MAFPVVNGTNISSDNVNVTTHTVSLPATVNAGELLYVEASINGAPTVTEPSGWTLLLDQIGSGLPAKGLWWAKVADGTEGGTTVTFGTSVAESSAHASYVIGDWFGTLAGVEISVASLGSNNKPDPPSLTASWGSDDNLFIASVNARRGDRAVTAFPTSYTDNQLQIETGTTGAGAGTGVATRNLASAIDDPATFTLSTGTPWICATLVVRPAGGAGGISIVGDTALFDFNALAGTVDLTGEILVTGSTASFDYVAISGLVDLTGQLLITGDTANFDYTALPGGVDLTGEIIVTGSTANFDYTSENGVVELGAVINVVGQTASFDFNGVSAEVSLTGEITIVGDTATFNYQALSGLVVIGQGQKIGAVTAGFADSIIGVQYKQNTITVNFGE